MLWSSCNWYHQCYCWVDRHGLETNSCSWGSWFYNINGYSWTRLYCLCRKHIKKILDHKHDVAIERLKKCLAIESVSLTTDIWSNYLVWQSGNPHVFRIIIILQAAQTSLSMLAIENPGIRQSCRVCAKHRKLSHVCFI